MPWFDYKALTPGGTLMAGRMEASGGDSAADTLNKMGLDVRELCQAKAPAAEPTISAEDLIFFNDQLASLADAGIALDEGLAQLARDVESQQLQSWIEAIVEDLRRGRGLDEAVAAREACLPVLYGKVIRAGIQAGRLPATLLDLNHHLRLMANTRRIIWELTSYPLLVITLELLVVSTFFLFLMPQIGQIFSDFGARLPLLTEIVMSVSDHFVYVLAGMVVIIAGVVIVWRLLRFSEDRRAMRDRILLHVPILGRIHRASLISRFLRAFASTVSSGIPLPLSLRLSAGAAGSRLLIADAEMLAREVEVGKSIFVAGQSARVIPPLFGFCVQTAVGRRALPQAIEKLAQSYESRAIHTQAMLRTLLFPLMIIFIGGLLAVCVLALFLPLVSLINSMLVLSG